MIINAKVTNKILEILKGDDGLKPVVVCHNKDYKLKIQFDSEWDGVVTKTARFVWVSDGQANKVDMPFTGNEVGIPEVARTSSLIIGVFAGDLCTTTPGTITCRQSILCEEGLPVEPSADVYAQIMVLLNEGYYVPHVEDLGEGILEFTFEPQHEGLPSVEPVQFTLPKGDRGTGILNVLTAPKSGFSPVPEFNGRTPNYRSELSKVKAEAGVDEVLVGDVVRWSSNLYDVIGLDDTYVYYGIQTNLRGATGAQGKSAYEYARDGGYTGTEEGFSKNLANAPEWVETKTKKSGNTVVISEQTLTNGMWSGLQTAVQLGIEYAVHINNTFYTCIAYEDGDGGIYLGNPTLYGIKSRPHNNEPFCVTMMNGSVTSGLFFKDVSLNYPIAFKVTDIVETTERKLPNNYTPDCAIKSVNGKTPDANGNVTVDMGEWLATKSESGGGIVVEETSYNFTGSMLLLGTSQKGFKVNAGVTYDAYWNGTKYTCTAFEYSGELFMGNGNLMTNAEIGENPSSNADAPFIYSGYNDTINMVTKNTNTAETITVSVTTERVVEYNKLPKEYLPDDLGGVGSASIDVTATAGQTIIVKEVDSNGKPTKWESADHQPRTHWEAVEEAYILPEREVSFSGGQAIIDEYTALITGAMYNVTLNGETYRCECTELDDGSGNVAKILGNQLVFGGEDTGEPFLVMSSQSEALVATVFVDLTGALTECSVSIYGAMLVTHKLDPKYLDETYIGEVVRENTERNFENFLSRTYSLVLGLSWGQEKEINNRPEFQGREISMRNVYNGMASGHKSLYVHLLIEDDYKFTYLVIANAADYNDSIFMYSLFDHNGETALFKLKEGADGILRASISKITL